MFNRQNPKSETHAQDRIRRRFADLLSRPADTNISECTPRETISEETIIRERVEALLRLATIVGAATSTKQPR
jgi:hypothetical protein